MSWKRKIPNMLTFSRMFATLLLGFHMALGIKFSERLLLIFVLTGYIYLSDFFDGRLAKKWNCCSSLGAKADIAADLFYIVSQEILLIWHGLMHPAILFFVLCEFFIFAITSKLHTNQTGKKAFWFDRAGRFTAVYYYIMPLIYLLFPLLGHNIIGQSTVLIANLICFTLTIFAVISRLRIFIKR